MLCVLALASAWLFEPFDPVVMIVTGAILLSCSRLLARWSIDRLWHLEHHRAVAHFFGGYPGWLFWNTMVVASLGLGWLASGIGKLA